MERFVDLMRHVVHLSDTCLEGLRHIPFQVENVLYEDSMRLFSDTLEAYVRMQSAVEFLSAQMSTEMVWATEPDRMNEAFEKIVQAYDGKQWDQVSLTVSLVLIPEFERWKKKFEETAQRFILS